ncbi:hypothetical protein [Cytophaga aurantiaca]|uniref:hypothetical protein n=1 Tax=Cytophaga aurantiaca TaxID=29530 RepID=UPI00036EBD3D|nr:hypothetical protein [Cytophaga aurantiaca]
MTTKNNSKRYIGNLNIFQEIYQAAYFIVYKKFFYRRKTTIEIADSVKFEGHRNTFSNIHVPFISFILIAILFSISIGYQVDPLVSLLIFVGVLLFVFLKLNNFNRRYFINQKRYQTILLRKWTDFSMQSRIGAIIYLIMMVSPFLGLAFIFI